MSGGRLTYDERLQIETLWRVGRSIPQIAEHIGRHASTVWREIGRNNSHRHGPKNPAGRHGSGGLGVVPSSVADGDAADRWDSAECGVAAVMVVGVQPAGQGSGAFG